MQCSAWKSDRTRNRAQNDPNYCPMQSQTLGVERSLPKLDEHTHTHTHACTNTHIHTHTCMHKHTHVNIHIDLYAFYSQLSHFVCQNMDGKIFGKMMDKNLQDCTYFFPETCGWCLFQCMHVCRSFLYNTISGGKAEQQSKENSLFVSLLNV